MASFNDVVTVIRGLEDRTVNNRGTVSGRFFASTVSLRDAFNNCLEDDEGTLTIENDISTNACTIGQTFDVEIRSPRNGLLVNNITILLAVQANLVEAPSEFYLVDEDVYSGDLSIKNESVNLYLATIDFFEIIKPCAAFFEPSTLIQELVFIRNNKKFSIPVVYSANNLTSDIKVAIDNLATFIGSNDVHRQQRLSILAEVICELTENEPDNKRFVRLLENVKDLRELADKKYQLFTSGFSYQKIKDDIEAAKIEYLNKINHSLSDIQTQLLGVPAELIIVFTQMKKSNGFDEIFWANSAILFGALFITVLIIKLIGNQKHTLHNIDYEVSRQKQKLDKEHFDIASQFENVFDLLETRGKIQINALFWIKICVIGVFIVSCVYMYTLTPNLRTCLITSPNIQKYVCILPSEP